MQANRTNNTQARVLLTSALDQPAAGVALSPTQLTRSSASLLMVNVTNTR